MDHRLLADLHIARMRVESQRTRVEFLKTLHRDVTLAERKLRRCFAILQLMRLERQRSIQY